MWVWPTFRLHTIREKNKLRSFAYDIEKNIWQMFIYRLKTRTTQHVTLKCFWVFKKYKTKLVKTIIKEIKVCRLIRFRASGVKIKLHFCSATETRPSAANNRNLWTSTMSEAEVRFILYQVIRLIRVLPVVPRFCHDLGTTPVWTFAWILTCLPRFSLHGSCQGLKKTLPRVPCNIISSYLGKTCLSKHDIDKTTRFYAIMSRLLKS